MFYLTAWSPVVILGVKELTTLKIGRLQMASKETKPVNGYYYRILKNSSSYQDVEFKPHELVDLFEIIKKSSLTERTINVSNSDRQLLFKEDLEGTIELEEFDGYISCVFTNLRSSDNTPYLSSLQKNKRVFRAIDKDPDEVFAETMHIMVSKKTGCILVVLNRMAGTENILISYLNNFLNNNGIDLPCKQEKTNILSIAPVMKIDCFKLVEEMALVKEFSIHFNYPNPKSGAVESILDVPMLSNEQMPVQFGSYSLEFKAKGRKITGSFISRHIRGLMKGSDYRITTCKVKGMNVMDNISVVDFIKESYITRFEIPFSNGTKRIDNKELVKAMHADFIKKDAKVFSVVYTI